MGTLFTYRYVYFVHTCTRVYMDVDVLEKIKSASRGCGFTEVSSNVGPEPN